MIAASVVLPRLEIGAEVPFLIDTGAARTCLTSIAAATAGLLPSQLDDSVTIRKETSQGVGGESESYIVEENALLAFEEESEDGDRYSLHIEYEPEIRISAGAPLNLLGRDVLNRFEMSYSPSESTIVLDRDNFAGGRYECIGATEELSPSLRDF